MKYTYTATIYFDEEEIDHQNGNDVDELYHWMLISSQGKFGNFHGKIVHNKTHKVIKSFKNSPPD